MKGFLCCRAFHSADGTLRKRIRDYSNTESIFPLTVQLAWLEISESAQEMSLSATYYLSSLPPQLYTLRSPPSTRQHGLPAPRAPRRFCLGASAHAPRSLGGVVLPQLCLPIEAQIRLPLPSKTCLNIPMFSAFCSSQLLPHLQSYLCVRD